MGREDKAPQTERRGRSAQERRGKPGQSLSEEIMELDANLLEMLVRRSMLMGKLRKGKTHASTPGIIKSEKQIRSAWERQAGRLSRSPRLSRQLFSLIHELEVHPERAESDHAPFNLSPVRHSVNIDAPGPGSTTIAQLAFALAAASGRPTRISSVLPSVPMLTCIRAFEQVGVNVAWDNGTLVLDGKSLPDYYGKAVFLGDDPLTMYLFIFLGLGKTGKLRFTGGTILKDTDLSSLMRFLPALGARLAPVVPGTKGMPANLECSGNLPDEIIIPADFPVEAVLAVLLAALTWRHKISINLAEQPLLRRKGIIDLAKRFFAMVPGLGQALENSIDYNGYAVSDLDFPAEVQAPLDPVMCAAILSLPIFTGGVVKLSGRWANLCQSDELIDILKIFGLEIKADNLHVSCKLQPGSVWPEVLELDELSPSYHPLFWVLNARLAVRAREVIRIRRYPADADLELAEDFMAQVGLRLEELNGVIVISPMDPAEFKTVASKTYGWPCPDSNWGLAMSLAAFIRQNLKISNPGCVSDMLPEYWYFYNGLPSPKERGVSKIADNADADRAPRRRIMTDVVVEPELRDDLEGEA